MQATTEAKLAAALRQLMNYVGGWDLPRSHPCGIGRDTLAAYDAGQPVSAIAPDTINTQEAVLNVADDYVKDRMDETNGGRDSLCDLIYEAIAHATGVLGVWLTEDASDAIHEELTDRHTLTTDDSRSDGPHHHFERK